MATSIVQGRRSYATDLTDAQWSLIEPILPAPNLTGRYEKHPRREIVNALFYLLRTGCAWRMLPHDLPPWQTVYRYFRRWSNDGTVDAIHDRLRDRLRDADGRDPMVSAGIIDAQSVKGADTVGTPTRGYDAGKRINGRSLEPGSGCPRRGWRGCVSPSATRYLEPVADVQVAGRGREIGDAVPSDGCSSCIRHDAATRSPGGGALRPCPAHEASAQSPDCHPARPPC